MTSAFDQRIVKVTIAFADSTNTFDGLYIRATGQKFASALSNSCNCTIYNMTKTQRNFILSQTSPLNPNRTNVRLTLEVGRESYGTFTLFDGGVWKSTMMQPPDIGILLDCFTNTFAATKSNARTYTAFTLLSAMAQNIAIDLGLTLLFQATDKNIGNISHTGSVAAQIQQLNNVGGIKAFVSNNNLVVIDEDKALIGAPRIINAATGMVGIPQITELGVFVTLMMDNTINLGGNIVIQSEENPVSNGMYVVDRIDYDIANREQPFFQTIQGRAPNRAAANVS